LAAFIASIFLLTFIKQKNFFKHETPKTGIPSARSITHRVFSENNTNIMLLFFLQHGLIGLTKSVALEFATTPVTCNAICPGWVLTPLVQAQIDALALREGLDNEAASKRLLGAKQPSQAFVSVQQIASLAAYLASDDASQVRGAHWKTWMEASSPHEPPYRPTQTCSSDWRLAWHCRAIVRRLIEDGFFVSNLDVQAPSQPLAQERFFAADLGKTENIADYLARATRDCAALNLVNNVGISLPALLEDISNELM
jgi:Enoyl-(Acyl carrier protein) reductase